MLNGILLPGLVVINPRSGDRRPTPDELRLAAERLGISAHVLSPREDAADAARSRPAAVLGVAGGDGTLGAVAAVAIERRLPFVCVPYGTRNHFARDLGLDPDDPVAALSAFEGAERTVDAARVGGRLFLNNVSLGLYAGLVHERTRRRLRREALAGTRALLRSLRRRRVRLQIDGRASESRAVVVANNGYRLDLFSIGERERLDEGRLYLYEAEGLLAGRWRERAGTSFRIDSHRPLRAAVDGEAVLLDGPAEFEIEPGALRVLVPP